MESIVINSGRTEGEIIAPPSKSMTIRAFAVGLLADGISTILNPSSSKDALASISVAEKLGALINMEEGKTIIEGTSGLLKEKVDKIDCGESGLCARMFIPICALREKEIVLDGSGSLRKRPIGNLKELEQFNILCKSNDGYLPVRVKGRIRGVDAKIDGSFTSQLITGLLLALPLVDRDSTLSLRNLKSKPYVLMTIDILKMAGVKIETDPNLSTILIKGSQKFNPITYSVEGDWSSASFFLVAGAISGGLFVKNLNTQSTQADRKILDVLHYCGAVIEALPQGIRVERKELRAFEFDVSDSPDLFPPLCILAACAEGISTIYGTDRQLFKESNRLERICEGFTRLGVRFELSQGKISIEGRENIGSGTIDPMGDHRIAMAFAILGLRSKEGVRISNPGCVNKSYPEFFTELMRIKK